ncbi:phage tail sheath family protein [Escherichia coli]|uniref:phage tail sheath subtilisin-like domain-containing protein n=1 Tax=Escherichia coli TaxID=562 RepID=UPI0010AD3312|nr:phage tail sheath family protein [Escherichia coli]EFC3134066.1 phage tail sheath family protein [Escherichia coli]TJR91545.1 phage tail sheath family protein [Escherichia coli]HAH5438678.1 phage tail sheath family protein [Escherichia coli]HAW8163481.1 phage tail sheath family protein [Escherichia coli]HAW8340648.1 phage tail sheath family protein [Escherichia coli]
MAEKRFHGVRVTENTDLVTAINDVDSSVIGIVAVADDADTGQFPLNKPVLITRVSSVLGKAGKAGTLYKALKAISDQVSTRVIVVRVEAAKEGAENKTQDQLVIGTTEEDGSYSGMQALLVAEQMEGIGYRPRILAAPGLESDAVTAALVTVAGKMRAFAYSGCPGCTKPSDAIAFRKKISGREIMLLWPDFIAFNPVSGKNETFPTAAYACGLRARLDHEQGWHRSLSNMPVKNVLGVSASVSWSLQDENSDANTLNNSEVTTLIHQGDGSFRFWGNRTPDTSEYIFEVSARTAQQLADSIAEGQLQVVDSPLTPSNAKDAVSAIKAKLDSLVTAGKLIGAECWFDIVDNNTTSLRQGIVRIRYKYTPVPPMECMELYQTFTDEFFGSAFASLGGS